MKELVTVPGVNMESSDIFAISFLLINLTFVSNELHYVAY